MKSKPHSSMIIGIDNISPGVSTHLKAVGGMRGFLTDLVEGLPLDNPDLEFRLFTPRWADPFAIQLPSNCRLITCDVPRNRFGRVIYEQTLLPRLIRKSGVGLWLGTCNALPPAHGWRSALVMQSLQYLTQASAFGFIRRSYLQRIAKVSVRRADLVVALSNVGRKQILDAMDVAPEKVTVIHNWLPRSFRERNVDGNAIDTDEPAVGANGPYILCVSAFYGYKNIPRLVKAFAVVRRQCPEVSLVLVGAETAELRYTEVQALINELGLDGAVTLAGRVDDKQMRSLYQGALVVAMPSMEETFGLPILEALHYGRPVVTSRDSPMAEIAGLAGVLVNPADESSIAEGLMRVITDKELRGRLAARAPEEASRFGHKASISKLSQVLRGLLFQR